MSAVGVKAYCETKRPITLGIAPLCALGVGSRTQTTSGSVRSHGSLGAQERQNSYKSRAEETRTKVTST